jgi:hypothetical protein
MELSPVVFWIGLLVPAALLVLGVGAVVEPPASIFLGFVLGGVWGFFWSNVASYQ